MLDWYGSVVRGKFAKDIEVKAILDGDRAKPFGATVTKANENGTTLFSDLGIQGRPGSGPHSISFEAISGTNVVTSVAPVLAWIDVCGENLYLEGDRCSKCPTRSVSAPGSMIRTDCTCDSTTFPGVFEDSSGECTFCPANSNLKAGVTHGSIETVCLCRENYYRGVAQGRKEVKVSCIKCPTRSISAAGSTSSQDCTREEEDLFADTITGEFVNCPVNSVLQNGVTSGVPENVCSCSVNFYRLMTKGVMICAKCPASSTSPKNSVASTNCTCDEGFYPTDKNHAACARPDWITVDKCDDAQFLNNTSLDKFDWRCESCPVGGACRGEITLQGIQALYGWSRCPVLDKDNKPLFEQCVYGPSCLGGKNPLLVGLFPAQNNTDFATMDHTESCNGALAYSNVTTRCSTCKPGYTPDAQGRCFPCDDSGAALTILFMLIIFLLFILMIGLKMRSSGRKKAAHSTLKRTLLNHLQMVSIVMSLNVPWPSVVRDLLVGASSVMLFGARSSQSSELQCVNGASVAEVFYGTLILAVALPVVMAVVSWVYWFGCVPQCPALGCDKNIRLSDKCIKKNPFVSTAPRGSPASTVPTSGNAGDTAVHWKSTRDGFLVTNVYFLFLFSPSLIRMSFETFQCEMLCDASLQVMAIDESEPCYAWRHQAIVFVVAVPTLIMLPISTVLALLYLRAHRHELKTNKKLILRFGLIFSGYASHRWYWEIFVILRKVVLILIVTFGRSNQSQLHFSMGSLVVMLYLQERGKPFEDDIVAGKSHQEQQILNKQRAENHQLHLVEIGSLVVLCTMIWVAVFFTLEGSETNGDLVLSFLVIMSNVVFVSMCGYLGCRKFGEHNQKHLSRLNSLWRAITRLCCGRTTTSATKIPEVQMAESNFRTNQEQEKRESILVISDDGLRSETALDEDLVTSKEDEHGKMQWVQHKDDGGALYYENKESGRTTWTHRDSSGDMVKGAGADMANPMKNNKTGGNVNMEWVQHEDDRGTPFYENKASGRTW